METEVFLIPIISILGFWGAVITWIFMYYRSRHQQRMALIESGMNADIFSEKKLDDKYSALKFGMLLTGIGLCFFLGIVAETTLNLEEGLGIFPMTFVGGGLGLILYYRIMSAKDEH